MLMKRIVTCMILVLLVLFPQGCTKKVDTTSPKGITEAFLESMKDGEYEKACKYAGTEFDKKTYENSVALQKNAMKETYKLMEYTIGEEKIDKDKATVSVKVKNINYIDTMNDAVYDTIKNKKDDAYTAKKFKELMKKAKTNENELLVNYRKEKGKWIFDGSNSQLYAAMLGYLYLPKN